MTTLSNLLTKDAELSRRILIPDHKIVLKKTAALFAHSGDSWLIGAGLALLWGFGPKAWRTDIQLLFIGIVITALAVLVLKFTIKRPRPEGEWGQIWLGLLMILWTLLVAAARVGLGVHYLSDILVGITIGAVIGGIVFLIFG